MDARWRSHKVGARTRRPQRPQFDNPATLSPAQQAGYYFWCWGRENPQLAGKAWMPYKMNAQSFARMRNQQSKHDVQGCTMAVHKVGARTRRPQRPQTQGCVIVLAQSFARCETNRASTIRQHRYTFARSTSGVLFFGAAGGRTRNLRVRQGCWQFTRDSAVLEGLVRGVRG